MNRAGVAASPRCKCGHVTRMTCPDCGVPICEECAQEAPVALQYVGDGGAYGIGEEEWFFCPVCAQSEQLYYIGVMRELSEWEVSPEASPEDGELETEYTGTASPETNWLTAGELASIERRRKQEEQKAHQRMQRFLDD